MSNLDARRRIDRHADLLAEALARTIDGVPYDPLEMETPAKVAALTARVGHGQRRAKKKQDTGAKRKTKAA